MINQDKVKLMARIQHFENTEEEALKAYSMYQRDYLGMYMLRSFFAYLLLLCIFGVGFCLYHWDTFMTTTSFDAIYSAGKGLLIGFGLLAIPVMVMSYIIYWFRYRKSMKKIKGHLENLKKLDEYYTQETEPVKVAE